MIFYFCFSYQHLLYTPVDTAWKRKFPNTDDMKAKYEWLRGSYSISMHLMVLYGTWYTTVKSGVINVGSKFYIPEQIPYMGWCSRITGWLKQNLRCVFTLHPLSNILIVAMHANFHNPSFKNVVVLGFKYFFFILNIPNIIVYYCLWTLSPKIFSLSGTSILPILQYNPRPHILLFILNQIYTCNM